MQLKSTMLSWVDNMVHFTGNFLIRKTIFSIPYPVNWGKLSQITEVSSLVILYNNRVTTIVRVNENLSYNYHECL